MKRFQLFLFSVGFVLLASGCSQPPVEQLATAQKAVGEAASLEAETYAGDQYQKASDALKAAQAEIEAQNQAWFFQRNYSGALRLVEEASQTASAASAAAKAGKEQARQEAEAALAEANRALGEAMAILQSAPAGKGTQADLEALRADLDAAVASLGQAQKSFENSQFFQAVSQGKSVTTKADAIRAEIAQALTKVRRPRRG